VVVPAYNEARRVGESLKTIFQYLQLATELSELILVDDGSDDKTAEVAKACLFDHASNVSAHVLTYERNRGKGYAVRAGLLASRAPVTVFTDADLSTPITELPKLLDPIARGQCDLTFGSRALDGRLIGQHQPWVRETAGRMFNVLVRAVTRLPFHDTQCGFKAFRMSACRPVIEAASVDRFGFDVELLYVAYRAGLRLLEIPVRWDHRDGTTVRMGRDSWCMLQEIRQVRRKAAIGAYDQAINTIWSNRERDWLPQPIMSEAYSGANPPIG
jgi:glycosyltransferase involved in cell wall biosynthesis